MPETCQTRPTGGGRWRWTVVFDAGGEAPSLVLELVDGKPLLIGRNPACAVRLPTLAAADRHARLELREGIAWIVDLDSPTGTRVDGSPLEGATRLKPGSRVEIACYVLAVRAVDLGPPAVTTTPDSDGEAVELLDQQIESIRAHREAHVQTEKQRRQQFDNEWEQVLVSLQRLQARLASDARVAAVQFDRSGQELTIKLNADAKPGQVSFLIAPYHPHGRYPDVLAVWVFEKGAEPAWFESPLQALRHLVRRIAVRLA